MKNEKNILWFNELSIEDVPLVGGKNAALGEMYSNFSKFNINVPNGFAVTAHAYRDFLSKTGLKEEIKDILSDLDTHNLKNLQNRGKKVRDAILKATLPEEIQRDVRDAYKKLMEDSPRASVAVRSSATAEDLPDASFAGQQETYLNVRGADDVVLATKKCIASLFTDRAISYRADKGFSHFDIALSVGVQIMVRSDSGESGVAFSIDTETGFDKVVIINSSYGLGEMVVQGKVTPDEFIVFKPTLEKGKKAIIGKNLGTKDVKMIYGNNKTKIVSVPINDRLRYSLSESEILELSKWVVMVENYFSDKHKRYQPMDVEWAKDGVTKKLYIVQARPETVHSTASKNVFYEYKVSGKGSVISQGTAVGSKIATGKVRVIKNVKNIHNFKKGEILVTEVTDPDWEPIMKIASAIVTDKGGRTSHAAIVSRELGIPCIVGAENATSKLKNGHEVTVDCSSGKIGLVYNKKLSFQRIEHHLAKLEKTKTKIMVNIGSPDEAFKNHYLPAEGVGLGRLEFIINDHIKVHPNALIEFQKLKKSSDKNKRRVAQQIELLTKGYKNKEEFYIDELAEGIAKIAAVAWPHSAIIRFSDFKTNEYRALLGGELYEPEESNPMIGWRGASRYYHPHFKNAFKLECLAIKKVREYMGLENVIPMIPFCRTVKEASEVLEIMESAGLDRKKDETLKVYMMCEIPSNVILADEFLNLFDGYSIGSNDLTQLTVGLDRDSGMLSNIANENDESVRKLISNAIQACLRRGKYIGLCGQAPSDYPEYAEFLVREGISSFSLNPDTVIKTIPFVAKSEKRFENK